LRGGEEGKKEEENGRKKERKKERTAARNNYIHITHTAGYSSPRLKPVAKFTARSIPKNYAVAPASTDFTTHRCARI